MNINYAEYRDKVYACWIGKNIGGTMGAPYEGTTEILEVKGFKTKKGEVLPNDDLDLQLVWLNAAEQNGIQAINARLLGQYWLSFITPPWNEYGIAKCNIRSGVLPPASGDFNNDWKNSNGAWIRTEIWACIFPARPDCAALYAIEDASVDHGVGEGTNAAVFISAMQSAAFVLSGIRACIDVALSKIPEGCRVANSVRKAIECFENNIPVNEARNIICNQNADLGNGWFEAPSNVGYTVLGLLYGNGDFKKSMLTAINCGDDTDCTAATVGATLGILGGTKAIPDDWREYIGDEIATVSICRGTAVGIPSSCTELSERVIRLAVRSADCIYDTPHYRGNWQRVTFADEPTGITADDVAKNAEPTEQALSERYTECPLVKNRMAELKPNTVMQSFIFAYAAASVDSLTVNRESGNRLHLHIASKINELGNIPYMLSFRWWLPEGFTADGPTSAFLPGVERHTDGCVDLDFTLHCGENVLPKNRIVLEITSDSRGEAGYIPIVLFG